MSYRNEDKKIRNDKSPFASDGGSTQGRSLTARNRLKFPSFGGVPAGWFYPANLRSLKAAGAEPPPYKCIIR